MSNDKCCNGEKECCEQREFFGWWKKKAENAEVTFTLTEVVDLLEQVKEFNAGAIDKWLSKHVDKVLARKVEEKKQR